MKELFASWRYNSEFKRLVVLFLLLPFLKQSDIVDVNTIFKELATMVHEQGEMIDSIEANVETAQMRVEEGTNQLSTAASYQVIHLKRCFKERILQNIVCFFFLDKNTTKKMFHSYYSGCCGDHYYRYNNLAVALIPAVSLYSLFHFPDQYYNHLYITGDSRHSNNAILSFPSHTSEISSSTSNPG